MKRATILVVLGAILSLAACQKTPVAELSVARNDYSVEASGGSINVDVSSNVSLTVSISENWVTQAGAPSAGSGTYVFSVKHNDGYDSRTATISFSNAERGVYETVTVTQAQQDAIIPGGNEYSLFYEEQTFSLPVSSNVDFSVSVSGGEWIKSLTARGMTTTTLQFSIEENSGKSTREALINISSGNLRQSIKVKQVPTTHRPNTKEEWTESYATTQRIAELTEQIPELQHPNAGGEWDTKAIVDKLIEQEEVLYAVPDRSGKTIFIMQRDSTILPVVLEYDEEDDSGQEEGSEAIASVLESIETTGTRSETEDDGRKKVSPKGSGKKVLILSPFQSSHVVGGEEEGNMNINIRTLTPLLNAAGYDDINYLHDDQVTLEHFYGDFWLEHDLILLRTHGGHWYKEYLKDPDTNEYILDAQGHRIPLSDPYTVVTVCESRDLSFLNTLDLEERTLLRRFIKGGSVGLAVGREWFENSMHGTGKFPDSILILLSCHSYETWDDVLDTSVDAFHDAFSGMISYCGFNGTISRTTATATLHSLVRSLSRGMSFKDAVSYLHSDQDWIDIQSVYPPWNDKFNYSSEDDAFLVDPRAQALDHLVDKGKATLMWMVNPSAGEYRYDVYLDDKLKTNNSQTGNRITNIPISAGHHEWYVLASLVVNGRVVASYKSRKDGFDVSDSEVANFININTSPAQSVTGQSALINVMVEANWTPDIVERGVVYSSSDKTPRVGASDCKTVTFNGARESFTVTMTGLSSSTSYYARGYIAENVNGERKYHYGDVMSFTTTGQASGPKTSVSKTSITFKDVKVGGSGEETFTLSARGDEDLEFEIICPDGFSSNYADGNKHRMRAGSDRTIGVTFSPTAVRNYSGLMTIKTNDPTASVLTISLSGKGIRSSSGGTDGDGDLLTVATGTPTYVNFYRATIPYSFSYNDPSNKPQIYQKGIIFSSTDSNPTFSTADREFNYDEQNGVATLKDLKPQTTYYARAYVITQSPSSFLYGNVVEFTTGKRNRNGLENGQLWIDMGLSVMWAGMNIGAMDPESYGHYFAWGETERKSSYSWSNYKWCKGERGTITKYCSDAKDEQYGYVFSYNGFEDHKHILDPEDDVAHVKWKSTWKIPSYNEWHELLNPDNCTWEWTELNGIKGYSVVSKKTGGQIFLPAAGSIFGNEKSGVNEDLYYWISWQGWGDANDAGVMDQYVVSSSLEANPFWLNYGAMPRCAGVPIRPVWEY